jgi:hypothetical protein
MIVFRHVQNPGEHHQQRMGHIWSFNHDQIYHNCLAQNFGHVMHEGKKVFPQDNSLGS